jgi:hypothetical protein
MKVPPAQVKITGITSFNLSFPDGCPTTVELKASEDPGMSGKFASEEHSFSQDGTSGPVLYYYHQSTYYGVIQYLTYKDASKNLSCMDPGVAPPPYPGGLMVDILWPSTNNDLYTVSATGHLSCDDGKTWTAFTYTAEWSAFQK